MMKNCQQFISELFDEQDLLVFDREIRALLQEPAQVQYVVEPKITAVEVVLSYEQGSLKSAIAQTGPVITSVKTILTVPLTFVPLRRESPVPDYIEIIADVYMEDAALARLNQERRRKDVPAFSSTREAVEDTLHQTDPRVSAKRPLNYFCAGSAKRVGVPAQTHYQLLMALQELGLRVNRPHIQVGQGISEVIGHCLRLRAERRNFPYPVEGVLIRVNSLDLQKRLSPTFCDRRGKAVFSF